MVEAERLDSAIDRIADVNAGFQAALAAAEESSVRKERNRITREIHDIVGYTLTNQQMMIEASLILAGPGDGRLGELLSWPGGRGRWAPETRKTLYELRRMGEPLSLDFGVILKVARNFESVTGVHVSVDFTNASGDDGHATVAVRIPPDPGEHDQRLRHGHARNIAITFREDASSMHVLVRDDGRGAPELVEGHRDQGMRERLAALGGELAVGTPSTASPSMPASP